LKGFTVPTFRELGAHPDIADALEARGIVSAFAIQELTLPLALSGSDLIGQARTGTGKTLGFGVPMLQRIDLPGGSKPQGLVVVPTRELCIQVASDLAQAGSVLGVRTEAIYGGRSYEPQLEALKKGVDIVVGTPGRLLDLARQGYLDLSAIRMLVLDEADEMLDLGFLPDVERILSQTPAGRQTMLFSATMPGPVIALSRRYLTQPTHVRAESPDENRTVPETQQHVFRTHALDKIEVLARILQSEGRGLTMVFCRTKRTCDKVAEELANRGFASGAVHGDLGQGARERALRAFRTGKIDVLIATDVAARGIDVPDVTHVVNYQCPEDEKTYLHRIGRTGRAGASGVAITFVDWDDIERWKMINSALDLPFPDPAETYSTSEWLYTELSIPTGTAGSLPRSQRVRAGLEAENLEDLGETGKARSPRGGQGGKPRTEPRTEPKTRSDEPRPARAPRERNRTRTRSGGAAGEANGQTSTTPSAQPAAPKDRDAGEGDAPRRRRRRGGRGRTRAGGEVSDAVDSAAE
jgi:superfamily II DNA/RNA helicase